jgi:hypothetical protein
MKNTNKLFISNLKILANIFPIKKMQIYDLETTIVFHTNNLLDGLLFFKNNILCKFKILTCISGIDYPNRAKKIKNKFYFKEDFQFRKPNYRTWKEEAIVLIISLGFIILLYCQHLQIMQLTNSVKELAESQELLKQELLRKESQIQLLEYAVTSSGLATDFASSKFYVLPVIFCIGFLGSTYFVTHGFGIASLKSLLPTALCTFIDTYLPFIQIVEKYNVFDEENKIMWLIQIVNRSEANLYGRFLDEEDYLGVNKFLWYLISFINS